MEIAALVNVLDHPHAAADYLQGWGLRDVTRAWQTLVELAETGLTLDLLAELCTRLREHLPRQSDPDAALEAFRRYLFAVRSPLGLAALLERDPGALPTLLAALLLGPEWSDLLVADPDAFALLRQADLQPQQWGALLADVQAEVGTSAHERSIVAALRRIRRRHLLRIAHAESLGRWPLETVSGQLADLGAALVGAALAAATRRVAATHQSTERPGKPLPRVAIIALGSLGGQDCDYRLPLDLLIAYDTPAAATAADSASLREPLERTGKLLVRLLEESAGPGAGCIRLLSLPDSPAMASVHAADDIVLGFDSFGRTWHRQQLLKARPIAGDLELGRSILGRLAPWVFRRYLNRADETGIKALKRRILLEATLHQDDWADLRLARGGLRDIENTVEFLQLLSGGDQPAARVPGTLGALAGLALAGVLGRDEQAILESSYRYARGLLHRLQVTSGVERQQLPEEDGQLARVAHGLELATDAAAFRADLRSRQDATWQTLRKLLSSAFPEEPPTTREVDLLLTPDPPAAEVRAALAPFGFDQPEEALAALHALAREQVPFLSTRRCRHLLASILPQLLCAVAATPQPDRTLDNLVRVSDSLGGKGVLWDLFRFHAPSLQLYVKLCAASPYLSGILTTNPGMIDELVDSLQLDKLPAPAELTATLRELWRGADDTLPILHDFKNAEHLRIGVREILGKEDIDRTHAALAAVAETCLVQIAEQEYARLVEKHGVPTIGPGPYEGEPCRLAIVGLGALGGREPDYHSPLELLFLYEAEGVTRPGRSRRSERTANNHFFTQLAQRVIKLAAQHTPKGRLAAVETPLRPLGVGGALALPLGDFAQHFASGAAPLWQWQALCQARCVSGAPPFTENVTALVQRLITQRPWDDADPGRLRRARHELERGAAPENLCRAAGGALDVQFLVQMLQLRHAAARPEVLETNTTAALRSLASAGALPARQADRLDHNYRFLKQVESALGLRETTRHHELPDQRLELAQLALLLGHSNPERLRDQCREAMAENRAIFDTLTT